MLTAKYQPNPPGGSGKRVLNGFYNTRIPRNAVSRLPALFHKIEVNL